MEWKNGTLRSMLKGNKEKVIFLFCSGLLLFVISLPNGKTTDSGWRAGTVEVVADVSESGRKQYTLVGGSGDPALRRVAGPGVRADPGGGGRYGGACHGPAPGGGPRGGPAGRGRQNAPAPKMEPPADLSWGGDLYNSMLGLGRGEPWAPSWAKGGSSGTQRIRRRWWGRRPTEILHHGSGTPRRR